MHLSFSLQVQVADECHAAPDPKALSDSFAACLAALAQNLPKDQAAKLERDICVRLCGDTESRQLNFDYRGRATPTNVLSFGGLSEEQDQSAWIEEGLNKKPPVLPLGDLAICWSVVGAEAAEQGKSLENHLRHLFLHGVLHLLGFDHEAEVAANEMEQLETATLVLLNVPSPYSDTAENG